MISVIYHFAPCLNIYGEDLGQGKGGDKGGCKGREDIRLSLMSLQNESFLHIKANLTGAYEPYQVKKNTLKIFLKPLKCLGMFRRKLFCFVAIWQRTGHWRFSFVGCTSRNQNSLMKMFDSWSNEKDSGS